MKYRIYRDDFLFNYKKKAKYFECLYCKLVSPKNFFLLCRHCLCVNCLKFYEKCPYDNDIDNKNKKIILKGQRQNAFQFVITENILHNFLMKCIFNGCNWAGTYKYFIETHYYECKYRLDNSLLNEYFKNKNDGNNKEKKEKKWKIKCLREIKKRKSQNTLIELDEDENSACYREGIQAENFIYLTDNENDIDNNSNIVENSENVENSIANNKNDNFIVLDSDDNDEENQEGEINEENNNNSNNSDNIYNEEEIITTNAKRKKIKIINDEEEEDEEEIKENKKEKEGYSNNGGEIAIYDIESEEENIKGEKVIEINENSEEINHSNEENNNINYEESNNSNEEDNNINEEESNNINEEENNINNEEINNINEEENHDDINDEEKEEDNYNENNSELEGEKFIPLNNISENIKFIKNIKNYGINEYNKSSLEINKEEEEKSFNIYEINFYDEDFYNNDENNLLGKKRKNLNIFIYFFFK